MAEIDTGYIWPEAYEATATSSLQEAVDLSRAIHQIRMTQVHHAPAGLAKEELSQRSALLDICVQLLSVRRDQAMDEACSRWSTYRSMTRV